MSKTMPKKIKLNNANVFPNSIKVVLSLEISRSHQNLLDLWRRCVWLWQLSESDVPYHLHFAVGLDHTHTVTPILLFKLIYYPPLKFLRPPPPTHLALLARANWDVLFFLVGRHSLRTGLNDCINSLVDMNNVFGTVISTNFVFWR